jgi:hypothetical protein
VAIETVHAVLFPEHPSNQYVVVERLDPATLDEAVAFNALCILTTASRDQLEVQRVTNKLRPDTMKNYFSAHVPESVRQYKSRMSALMAGGSQFWFAKIGPDARSALRREPMGMVELRLSRERLTQKMKMTPPTLTINKIAVAPVAQRKGMGTDMLFAVASFGGFSNDARLVVETVMDNPGNEWLRTLDFEQRHRPYVPPYKLPEGQTLSPTWYESAPLALRGVARKLLKKYSRLEAAKAVIIPT